MIEERCANVTLYRALAARIKKDYNPQVGITVVDSLHKGLVRELGIEDTEVYPWATLEEDLNAEGVDAINIAESLQRELFFRFPIREIPLGETLLYKDKGLQERRTVLDIAEEVYRLVKAA